MNSEEKFPSPEWMQVIKDKLNTDEHYAQVAKNWEGDMRLIIESDDILPKSLWFFLIYGMENVEMHTSKNKRRQKILHLF